MPAVCSPLFNVYYLICFPSIFHLRWYKKSFNLELQTTHDMSGRITHPELSARKIEWIVDQLVRNLNIMQRNFSAHSIFVFCSLLHWFTRSINLYSFLCILYLFSFPFALLICYVMLCYAMLCKDHFSLACLQCMTMECKSLVLALAYLGR